MSVKLICVKGPYAGQEFAIGARGTIIGRDPASANIVLDFPTISRSHANVFVAPDGRAVVQDLGSTNGTWTLSGAGERKKVTGEAILSNRERFSVGDGDDCIFEVVYTAEAPVGNAPEFAAQIFNAPLPSVPVQTRDLWSDSLRILSWILFVVFILSGVGTGYAAYQRLSLGAFLGELPLEIGDMLGSLKLTAFLVPSVLGIIGAFFTSARLDMAADTREIRNYLTKR